MSATSFRRLRSSLDLADLRSFSHQSLGEVNYTDDTLSVSNNFDMHINAANFLVDTSQETVKNESLKKQGMFLAVGSKTVRISMVLGSKVTDYGVYYLSDYLQDGFNK